MRRTVSCGQPARRKDLVARGISTRRLAAAVAEGRIIRPARGVYALPDACGRDVFLAEHQARLSCLNQAAALGLWVLREPLKLHVSAAHGRPIPGCVVHRGASSLLLTLRSCVKCGTELEALIVLESAVVLKHCTIQELRSVFDGREDRRGRTVVGLIDPQSMSIAETAARYHLRRAGYNVQAQFFVSGVGRLDLLIDGVLLVEIDGRRYHEGPEAFRADRARDTLLVIGGYPRLRIPAEVALYHPEVLLSNVRNALAAIRSAHDRRPL